MMSSLIAEKFTTFETALGRCAIAWNATGIASLQLPAESDGDIRRWHHRRVPGAVRDEPPSEVSMVMDAAVRYFRGEPVDFSGVVVDLRGQSDFFARIYTMLRTVAYGRTTTYGALAATLGAGPEAAREVGVAMATNPVPLVIPCHRVLAAGGKIGGFTAPGGAMTKLKMLHLENAQMPTPKAPSAPSSTQGTFEF
ncbi:methylated-DNA--[protein]-cysteine S-methyltransferase [Nitrospirillum sp. BR 11163]|uniref:methylated-DNA--[protein]-cysteine S-methyltransferase n=1 Tax=Nitrospirillum sp. BR 11163 TaxID=3104323 RepID=UPI002AFEA501|nr:methylated-DNA--[protein]-cysteine S-methyltransferase [Nitrospirillum sp. BR 11163]MEA1672827.1 methylated-DNA--[protein]-cysteine S-methyltransferase [Nitrospirillum sp. BR 11163]